MIRAGAVATDEFRAHVAACRADKLVPRWGSTPTYEWIITPDHSLNGSLSPSGKWHGRWVYLSDDGYYQESWYWYGDEVSEGEFARLNR